MSTYTSTAGLSAQELTFNGLIAVSVFVLDIWAVVNFPTPVFGVSSLYLASSLMSLVALSGKRGALVALYIGLFAAAVVTDRVNPFTPVLNLCNIVGVLPIYIRARSLRSDGKRLRAGQFVLMAGPLQAFLSGVWFLGLSSLIGMITPSVALSISWSWLLGGTIAATVVTAPIFVLFQRGVTKS